MPKIESIEIEEYTTPVEVFDLGVTDNHNYFVYPEYEGDTQGILVHNCHKANSNTFARIVSRWPSKIKAGVTATEKRKDQREFLIKEIVGPVVARVDIPQLQARVILHDMDYVKPKSAYKGPAGFVYATKFLSKHEKRNDTILEFVLKDIAKGHCIIIPTHFREHVSFLVAAINELAGHKIAEEFVGGSGKKNKEHREGVLERAKSRKTRVVVGIRSLLQLGLNVPAWSALYYIMPMSNEPNWKQESSRILTPDDSGLKRTPIIRMFVDKHMGLSLGCWSNTYKQSLKFKHVPTEGARKLAHDFFEIQGSNTRGSYNESNPYAESSSPVRAKKAKHNADDPYSGEAVATMKHGKTPRERHKSLKDRASKNAPSGLFNR